MSKVIWERHYFKNKDIRFLINDDITEYDIKSAGINLAKEFGYLDKKTIYKLEHMDKERRNREMGLMKIKNKQFIKNENKALIEARKLFIKSNNLSINNIISIKKDAIFTSKRCKELKFGNIEFVPKNKYTTYLLMNNLEFYHNMDKLDVKGINDELLDKHKNYMLYFFHKYFTSCEFGNRKLLIDEMIDFTYKYKSKLLDIGYYREFNANSSFMLNDTANNIAFIINNIDESYLREINISYNYFNYLVPMITMLI